MKNLHDKLNSKEFLNTLTSALNIKNHDYIVTNFLILSQAIYLRDIKKLILENFPLLKYKFNFFIYFLKFIDF